MTVSEAPAGARTPPLEDPYVGLTPFTEEYVDFFFGRETESSLVIGNLRAARLTLLYAESGVGKSSVLRAGVLARMHEFAAHDLESRGTPRLVPVVFSSWSERPVAALVHALGEAIRPYLGEGDLPELPEDDLEAALEAASEALDATVLVILDQFEEYFLYPDEEPEEERVAAQIARCVNRPDLRANFLISIREDSYAQLGDLFRGKVKNVYGNFLHLDFLDRGGAREAIERPIERVNELRPGEDPYSVEPALVAAVLDQVGRDEADDRIETTYLQLVMRRLWEEERGAGSPVLRLATLERLGGAQAIIGSHLDRAMEGGDDGAGLGHEQRLVAAAAFRFLVTSGGTKIALSAADLADLTGFPLAGVQPVLRHLSSPRLHILRPVVFDEEGSEPRYEIFHDALADPIRKWRTGIEEEEREARAKRERAEKEEAQRAAAAAEHQAQRERQRKRMALGALAVAVVALLVGVSIFALENKDLADQREADNQSVRAAERISEIAYAPTLGPAVAGLASVEGYRLSPTDEARNQALAQLQLNPGLPQVLAGHVRYAGTVAYWPGSENLVSGGFDSTVRLWGSNGEELGSPLVVGNNAVLGVAVSKSMGDGERIVAAGLDSGVLHLWEVNEAGEVKARSHRVLPVGAGGLRGLAFHPRVPGMLAVGSTDGTLELQRINPSGSPELLGRRKVRGGVYDLAFAADGSSLYVAGGGAGKAFGLSRSGFAAAAPVHKDGEAHAVATAPNGSYAFALGRRIRVWDAARRRELQLHLTDDVLSLGFARGGSVLVAGGEDWNVTTWDLTSGRLFGPPRMADQWEVEDVAVSEDGGEVAAVDGSGLLKLWSLKPISSLATTVGSLSPFEASEAVPWISSISVGSGGRVASAGGPAGTSIWSLREWADPASAPRPLARIEGESYAVSYRGNLLVTGRGDSFAVYGTGPPCRGRSADPCLLARPRRAYSEEVVSNLALRKYGSRLLLASTGILGGEGVFSLWDLTDARSGKVVHLSSRRIETEINRITLSPTEPLIAAGTEDGKLRLWDIDDPRDPDGVGIRHARGNENQPVAAISFSRDGTLLATGGKDQQVVLWRVNSRGADDVSVRATPGGTLVQTQTIFSLAFSPDGNILAAGDGDGLTCLYEVNTRRSIGSPSCLLGHSTRYGSGGIEATKFARLGDGRTVLLTAGTGQPIVAWDSLLWNLDDDDRVEERIVAGVCALAGRNLTQDEWNSVFASTMIADDRRQTCSQYPLP